MSHQVVTSAPMATLREHFPFSLFLQPIRLKAPYGNDSCCSDCRFGPWLLFSKPHQRPGKKLLSASASNGLYLQSKHQTLEQWAIVQIDKTTLIKRSFLVKSWSLLTKKCLAGQNPPHCYARVHCTVPWRHAEVRLSDGKLQQNLWLTCPMLSELISHFKKFWFLPLALCLASRHVRKLFSSQTALKFPVHLGRTAGPWIQTVQSQCLLGSPKPMDLSALQWKT